MKKIGKFLLILLASAMLISLAGCKPQEEAHVHTFSETWTSDETHHWHEATCEHIMEKSGKETHKWNEGVITKEPSEESEGIRTYTCKNCGEEKTEPIEKLAHTHKFAEDWSYDEIYHWHSATCGDTTETSGSEIHQWDEGKVTLEPSCTEEGIKIFFCSICKKEKTEVIERLAHTEDAGTVTTAATCLTKGEKIYKCETCNILLRTDELPELYSSPVDAETGLSATASSKYIYFGVFPKTVLPENSAVTVDEAVSVEMGANTYYKGNDGNYYAKLTENRSGSSEYTYTDGTTVKQKSASSIRYFKVEPIKWKVLTNNYNGKSLLFAEDILTANVPYYVDYSDRTIGGNTVYPNNYKYSTIRAYLNGAYESGDGQTKIYEGKGFLQTAFTSNAMLFIADTEVDNSAKTTFFDEDTYTNDYCCENTTDKIFLLSKSEVVNTNYGFAAFDIFGQESARIRVTTDYAKANYADQSTTIGYGGKWWQRSPSPSYVDSSMACFVYGMGDGISSRLGVVSTSCGVVPALSISF